MTSILAAPLADTWGVHIGTGWWIAMLVMMVLFCVAFVIGIALFARGGFGRWAERMDAFGGWRPQRRETPTEILDRRFAEGKIPVEEYQQRREVIASGAARDDGAAGEAEPPPASGKSERTRS